jgi:hypothetical protein
MLQSKPLQRQELAQALVLMISCACTASTALPARLSLGPISRCTFTPRSSLHEQRENSARKSSKCELLNNNSSSIVSQSLVTYDSSTYGQAAAASRLDNVPGTKHDTLHKKQHVTPDQRMRLRVACQSSTPTSALQLMLTLLQQKNKQHNIS